MPVMLPIDGPEAAASQSFVTCVIIKDSAKGLVEHRFICT